MDERMLNTIFFYSALEKEETEHGARREKKGSV